MMEQDLDELQAKLSAALAAFSNAERMITWRTVKQRDAYQIRDAARRQVAEVRDKLLILSRGLRPEEKETPTLEKVVEWITGEENTD